MYSSNKLASEPISRHSFGDLTGRVDPSLARYELSGRLSNAGTYIGDIRVPNIFDSGNVVQPGKLFYGKGTEHWSDIYWRSATDIRGVIRYIVFSEIRRDLQFKLFDLLAHSNTADRKQISLEGTAFIIRPSTIPNSHLAQTFAKSHRRKSVPQNEGTYSFRGLLKRE